MANNFAADFAEIWSRVQQEQFFKETVAVAIADTSMKSQMSSGDTFNKPYRSQNNIQTYTRGTSINIDDKTDTQEQLVVDKQYATGFYIDDMDTIQSNYNLIANYAKDDSQLLNIQIDSEVLAEALNATSVVDDGSIGGTPGNAITISTSNISSVFGAADKAMSKLNIPLKNKFAVISPDFLDTLTQFGISRETNLGDNSFTNGSVGKFRDYSLYMSNNLAGTAELSLATQPTADDTVTIEGITFKFVAAPAVAGDVDLGADVDGSRANLAAAINGGAGAGSTYIEVSADDRRLLQNASAVNNDTTNVLTVTFKGVGTLDVSKNLTDGTDTWTAAQQKQHNLFGIKKAISLVVQKNPMPSLRDVETKMGKNVLNAILFGVKTFSEGVKQLVDVQINQSAF